MWEKFRIRVFVISAYSRIVLRRILKAERTEDPLPDKGTRRKDAELKTAYFRRVPQRKFWEQSGQKILCPGKGTRRKYAELKYRRERTKWQKVRGIITRCSA